MRRRGFRGGCVARGATQAVLWRIGTEHETEGAEGHPTHVARRCAGGGGAGGLGGDEGLGLGSGWDPRGRVRP